MKPVEEAGVGRRARDDALDAFAGVAQIRGRAGGRGRALQSRLRGGARVVSVKRPFQKPEAEQHKSTGRLGRAA